jgi:diguanylate cyclase
VAKILIVDDNPINRKLAVAVLSYEGHEILEAADGSEGLRLVRATRPQLIISDILMPSMDGYGFVRELRADPFVGDVLVIFYTAYYHEKAASKLADALGVSRVILKPCTGAALARSVAEVLAGSAMDAVPVQNQNGFEQEHLNVVNEMLVQTADDLTYTQARLAGMTELNLQLASERDPRSLLDKVCRGARDLLGARYAVLAVGERGAGKARILSVSGIEFDEVAQGAVRVDSGLLGRVASDRRPWRAFSADGSPFDAGLPPYFPPARAFLAAPLASLSQSFGWICLADKVGEDSFSVDDEQILTVLGAQSGRIYENGSLYADVQHHAAQLMVEMEERERAVAGLRVSEERFRQLAENIQDALFVIAGDLSRTLYMSPAYERIWGASSADLLERRLPWVHAIHPDDLRRIRSQTGWNEGAITAKHELEFRISRPDGEVRWIFAQLFPVFDAPGVVASIVGVATDITERKRADEKIRHLNRVHAMLSGINSLIIRVADRAELFREVCRLAVEEGRFREVWCGWLDESTNFLMPAGSTGVSSAVASMRVSLDEQLQPDWAVPQAIRSGAPVTCNELQREDQGVSFYRDMLALGYHGLIVLPLLIEARAVGCLLLVAEESEFFDAAEMRLLLELSGDISFALDHIAKAEQITYLAYYDSLTGLANRTFFQERLAQHINAAVREGRSFALVIADPERFESVNETFSRRRGDELLRQLALSLTRLIGDATAVGKLGADQFVALIFDVEGLAAAQAAVEDLWRRWLGSAYMVEGADIRITAKSGIALFPNDSTDAETLLRNAEAALRNAKETGDRFLFYSPSLSARAAETVALENQLRGALERDEFILHYQPKVDLETRKLLGVEALIRWQSPQHGLVPPLKFIPFLEETGMIVDVGEWALRQASLDRSRWLERRPNAPRVAVNVSTIQLRRGDFVRSVSKIVRMAGSEAGLDIEVTESLIMNDAAENIEKLRAIRDLGVGIAIDDFGTGYSSLGYLTKLPAETLKIDRSFVIAMLDDPDAMTLVSSIISLAHSLKLTVVAEGVELEEQAKLLRLLRCEQMQGYLISKPLSFDDMTAYMARGRAAERREPGI